MRHDITVHHDITMPRDTTGLPVLVAGAGVSGRAAAAALVELGARVTVTDAVPDRLVDLPPGALAGDACELLPPGTALVVSGPGRRPDQALVVAAHAAGVPMVGEPELAWWLGARCPEPPVWLAVTGTNGKTTTVGMLATILRAAGFDATACGNIGYPVVAAVRAGHRVGQLGIVDGVLVDRAFDDDPTPLDAATEVHPGGPPGCTDALAAAAVARAYGVDPTSVATGIAAFRPGPHRSATVATVAGVRYVDDSKATNPHAAAASLAAQAPSRVVWIVGGLFKGASVDELVARNAGRLRAVVVIGTERGEIVGAFARHAPDVPVAEVVTGDDGHMTTAVRRAAALARPGDVVLLAPAAASMDQFVDYAQRGNAFAGAVAALRDQATT